MKSMECNSDQLQELQKQKRQLLQELFTVQKKLKGKSCMSPFILLANSVMHRTVMGWYLKTPCPSGWCFCCSTYVVDRTHK